MSAARNIAHRTEVLKGADRGGAEGDLMELNDWTSRRCSAATVPVPAAQDPGAAATPPWRARRNPSRTDARPSQPTRTISHCPGSVTAPGLVPWKPCWSYSENI